MGNKKVPESLAKVLKEIDLNIDDIPMTRKENSIVERILKEFRKLM